MVQRNSFLILLGAFVLLCPLKPFFAHGGLVQKKMRPVEISDHGNFIALRASQNFSMLNSGHCGIVITPLHSDKDYNDTIFIHGYRYNPQNKHYYEERGKACLSDIAGKIISCDHASLSSVSQATYHIFAFRHNGSTIQQVKPSSVLKVRPVINNSTRYVLNHAKAIRLRTVDVDSDFFTTVLYSIGSCITLAILARPTTRYLAHFLSSLYSRPVLLGSRPSMLVSRHAEMFSNLKDMCKKSESNREELAKRAQQEIHDTIVEEYPANNALDLYNKRIQDLINVYIDQIDDLTKKFPPVSSKGIEAMLTSEQEQDQQQIMRLRDVIENLIDESEKELKNHAFEIYEKWIQENNPAIYPTLQRRMKSYGKKNLEFAGEKKVSVQGNPTLLPNNGVIHR